MSFVPRSLAFVSFMLSAWTALGHPVINELMFHPAGTPEPLGQEWIEIFNPDATAADLSGWRISDGVAFTFPNVTSIPAGGYLIVAANVSEFNTTHPGFTGALVGGWTGRLSNSGERIRIETATGAAVDEVR